MPAKKQKRQPKKPKPVLVEPPVKEKPKKPDEPLFLPPYGAWSASQ